MKEVWRWRPPVALGHPHVTTRDITYGSYVIPKGSWIHLNSWYKYLHSFPKRSELIQVWLIGRYATIPSGMKTQIVSGRNVMHMIIQQQVSTIFPSGKDVANTSSQSQESINAKDPSKRDHFAFGAGRRVCTLNGSVY